MRFLLDVWVGIKQCPNRDNAAKQPLPETQRNIRKIIGAGSGNRTRALTLEGSYDTISPYPLNAPASISKLEYGQGTSARFVVHL
jgi:hypothetical protein